MDEYTDAITATLTAQAAKEAANIAGDSAEEAAQLVIEQAKTLEAWYYLFPEEEPGA